MSNELLGFTTLPNAGLKATIRSWPEQNGSGTVPIVKELGAVLEVTLKNVVPITSRLYTLCLASLV